MKYVNFKRDKVNYKTMCDLWNNTYGYIYPISQELFERNTSNIYEKASFIVYNEEEIVAFIISKIWIDKFFIPTYLESGWISLFFVAPKYRCQGIGSKLLEFAENELRKCGKTSIFLGKDYLNFFPGLPVDLKNSEDWFKKRGYERPYDTFDLIKQIKGLNCKKLPLKNQDIQFRIANIEDKEKLLSFMKKNWPGRWLKETIDYFENGGTGSEYVIGVDNNNVCAFAKIGYPNTDINLISYSLTWRNRFDALGGIGPLGVDSSYRHRNLGYDIVAFANNILVDANATDIIIDWTGLLDFYRHMGFEVFKSYYYMSKNDKKI
jgi:acetyltransferase, GNAT family